MKFTYQGNDYMITEDREHGYEIHKRYDKTGVLIEENRVERTDYVFSMYWQHQDELDYEHQRTLDELDSMADEMAGTGRF